MMLIMNKLFLVILLSFSGIVLAQSKKPTPSLEYFQRKYKYVKNRSYKGPSEKYTSPASMDESEENYPQSNSSSSSNGGKMEYSPEELERLREEKQQRQQNGSPSNNGGNAGSGPGAGSGGGNGKGGGSKPVDPKMGQPKPVEFDPPDVNIDIPDMDVPNIDGPNISASFWKWFLIVLGSVALIFLIYYIFRNYKPSNRKVKSEGSFADWNPETITKTELELRLEKAMLENDYRECVRIYFTFILKEMIRLRYISWKKDLTNFDYLLQASGKANYHLFEESVRIYDLVWYGEYDITLEDYKSVERHLDAHYKLLNQTNA